MGSKSIPSTIITTLKQKAAGSCCDLQRKSKNKIQKKRRDESGRGEIESISLPEGGNSLIKFKESMRSDHPS